MAEAVSRLKVQYKEKIIPALKKQFGYENLMQVPKLEKVVINWGLGAATQNPKIIDNAVSELTAIVGQKVVVTKAKKSISNFKLRANVPVGVMVTLRNERMYKFLDKFFNIVLPRIRDFKGVSDRSFDGRGNYTLGLKEQTIFPEINIDKVEKVTGMNICFTTTAKTDNEARQLLKELGMPFVKRENN
ncbi:MAG: 50S ribosomal protein L5 [Candidatus Wallbacteria bacterium]